MSTEWMKYKKMNWPKEALRRTLLLHFPGCKSVKEALAQAIKDKAELTELKKQLSGGTDAKKEGSEW